MRYLTPGPSQLYPTIPQHIEHAMRDGVLSWSHRGRDFQHMLSETLHSLRELFALPNDYHLLFFSSATEIWERMIRSCVTHETLHIVHGVFSGKSADIATQLGRNVVRKIAPEGEILPDLADLRVPQSVEMICVAHNESSTGVATPVANIHALKKNNPHALLAVDIVSSAPHPALDWGMVDIAYFSVQKGFGLPAGLGVACVSPEAMRRAREREEQDHDTGAYRSFARMADCMNKLQTFETPPVLHLYLLGRVARDMQAIGLARIREETERKATMLYDFFDSHPRYKPFVQNRALRSSTMIVVDTHGETEKILNHLKNEGIVLGAGYGAHRGDQLRIANFPAHTVEDVARLLQEVRRFP